MKTAILITGHMRSFARCFPTLHWHVFRHFMPEFATSVDGSAAGAGSRPEQNSGHTPGAEHGATGQAERTCDFFVSTVHDVDAASAEQLRAVYPQARVEINVASHQPELPIPVPPVAQDWTVGRMYSHEPYAISVHPQAILRQLWQLQRAWEHFSACVYKGSATVPKDGSVDGYDLVLRVRPDSWFRSFVLPPFIERSMSSRGISGTTGTTAYTPWWGRFGGVNDRFAILEPKAARAYFTTYSRIDELLKLGCPLHPESLVKASLEQQGCTVDDTLRAEFAKLFPLTDARPQVRGTFRQPEITEIDMAHMGASR